MPRPLRTVCGISIHALREEGDQLRINVAGRHLYFYPRPPRGGRRQQPYKISCPQGFLSTPSARRATTADGGFDAREIFLSPPSARRATPKNENVYLCNAISIPALREEGDIIVLSSITSRTDFYPRPPRGGRLQPALPPRSCGSYFYPRPPRGGRPAEDLHRIHEHDISIPALREEGDSGEWTNKKDQRNFYPRPPRGGRRETICHVRDRSSISIPALREEGDAVAARFLPG